ncbi:MAG: hypothetical protein LUD68_07450 [Rikenellaceae bacterium]|nr:hypothetical protein [Rikenellaceae bacterium]
MLLVLLLPLLRELLLLELLLLDPLELMRELLPDELLEELYEELEEEEPEEEVLLLRRTEELLPVVEEVSFRPELLPEVVPEAELPEPDEVVSEGRTEVPVPEELLLLPEGVAGVSRRLPDEVPEEEEDVVPVLPGRKPTELPEVRRSELVELPLEVFPEGRLFEGVAGRRSLLVPIEGVLGRGLFW